MPKRTEAEPVGLVEIAERLGVKQQTAQTWRHRKLLPAPKWMVSRQPAWDWRDVEVWARKTGRLAGELNSVDGGEIPIGIAVEFDHGDSGTNPA